MAVGPILPASGTPVRPDPAETDPITLLASLEPEHKEHALLFLSGYAPELFDFILQATEPDPAPRSSWTASPTAQPAASGSECSRPGETAGGTTAATASPAPRPSRLVTSPSSAGAPRQTRMPKAP
jgi:hypothetical protein